jgi:hypothetical protein
MKTYFTTKEDKILTEIYRRLNYFHKGNLDTELLYLALPSEAKIISKLDLIKPYSKETKRVANWYNLTDKGKTFFSHYNKDRIDNETNQIYFEGRSTKFFDIKYLV